MITGLLYTGIIQQSFFSVLKIWTEKLKKFWLSSQNSGDFFKNRFNLWYCEENKFTCKHNSQIKVVKCQF